MIKTIDIDGYTLEYTLIRRKNAKRLRLIVTPGGQVRISCGLFTSNRDIEMMIMRNGRWLLQTIKEKQTQIIQSQRKYIDGEKFLFLGKEYTLLVWKAIQTEVVIYGNFIILNVKNIDDYEEKRKAIDSWYTKQIKDIYTSRFNAIVEKHSELFAGKAILAIKEMKTRWGVCNRRQYRRGKKVEFARITLNSKMIYADIKALDSVIYHELVHLYEMGHKKSFYDMLLSLCPDYRGWQKHLSQSLIAYTH